MVREYGAVLANGYSKKALGEFRKRIRQEVSALKEQGTIKSFGLLKESQGDEGLYVFFEVQIDEEKFEKAMADLRKLA